MTEHGTDLTTDFARRAGTALVVGGTGGLGAAVCRELAVRGSDVAVTFRTNEPAARALAADISEWGRRAWTVELDLGREDAASIAAASVDAIAEVAEGVHTLVYAAGPTVPQRHLSTVDPAEVRRFLDADAAGFFAVAQACIPYLRQSKGAIVAITTAATHRYPVRDGLSSIPKAAVEAAVRGIAAEEGRFGVRANSVGPGMLTAGMAERLMDSGDLDERALEAARANIPLREFGEAADIVEAVCFLTSRRAGFITGQHLAVDGGFTV